jgi:molecular chaperone DnaK
VNAKDLGTGKEQSIKIVASQKLSEEEIKRMQHEAEAHAEEDRKFKEKAELLNQADSTSFATDKMLEELKGKIPESEAEKIKKTNEELKELLKPEEKNTEKIREKMDELNRIVQAASTELYKKAGQQRGGARDGGPGGGTGQQHGNQNDSDSDNPDNVVDADYKVEDDNK